MKTHKQIVLTLIGFGTLVTLGFFVYIASTRTTTSLENALLQIISLALGMGASYYFGRRSVGEAATEIIKPLAKSALRRLSSLHARLYRAADVIEAAEQPGDREDSQATLARLEEIVHGQLMTTDDAIEDWMDILLDKEISPDDVLDDWLDDLPADGLDDLPDDGRDFLPDDAEGLDLKPHENDTTEDEQ